jgi:trigger factor
VHADEHDHFIPGFTKQLIGAKPGEERTVTVTIPDEFPSQPKLQGLNVIYEVKVMQVKEKVLPELTDEFAKSWEAESVEKLREGVRDDLKSNQEGEAMRVVRAQVHEELMEKVSFAVPEPVQQNELRIVVESMVRTRRAGGASEEDIEKAKEQITAEANPIAMDRARWFFIHPLIAETEKVEVSREEVLRVIAMQAQQMGKDPQQHVKELADTNQISAIQNQIREQKVIELIAEHAEIELVDPPDPDPAEHDHDHGHSHG